MSVKGEKQALTSSWKAITETAPQLVASIGSVEQGIEVLERATDEKDAPTTEQLQAVEETLRGMIPDILAYREYLQKFLREALGGTYELPHPVFDLDPIARQSPDEQTTDRVKKSSPLLLTPRVQPLTPAELEAEGYVAGTGVEGTYSARLTLESSLRPEKIIQRLGELVAYQAYRAKPGELVWAVSGIIEFPSPKAGGGANSVLFACDPNAEGHPSPAECAIIVPQLVQAYNEQFGGAELRLEPQKAPLRCLIGLQEGYNDGPYPARQHTIDTVSDILDLPSDVVSVTPGIIFSARYRGPKAEKTYHEHGANLQGPLSARVPILRLANQTNQERAVEEIDGVHTQAYRRPRN